MSFALATGNGIGSSGEFLGPHPPEAGHGREPRGSVKLQGFADPHADRRWFNWLP
jgi:hypothetical protein